MKKLLLTTSFVIVAASLSACVPGNVKEAMENQKPRVKVSGQRLTHLDFDRADLSFDLQIKNPNPIGISLAGMDYDLKLAGNSFVSGNKAQKLRIPANRKSKVELPLSLSFTEIFEGLKKLSDKKTIPYELTTGLKIDVPLLGALRYPVTTRGTIPVPRLPSISVKGISMEKMSLSGARMLLKMEVDNPNVFGLGLNALNYDLTVNGQRWASGNKVNVGKIQKNGKSEISLPVTLNFMELGSGIYSLLNSNQALDYQFSGKLKANGDHPLIGNFSLPFDNRGSTTLVQ